MATIYLCDIPVGKNRIPIAHCFVLLQAGFSLMAIARHKRTLLPHVFTLTTLYLRTIWRFIFCGTFHGLTPSSFEYQENLTPYEAPFLFGVQTFLYLSIQDRQTAIAPQTQKYNYSTDPSITNFTDCH